MKPRDLIIQMCRQLGEAFRTQTREGNFETAHKLLRTRMILMGEWDIDDEEV